MFSGSNYSRWISLVTLSTRWIYFKTYTIRQMLSHRHDTFVCPQHILKTVNDTRWLGLPWNKNAKLNFVRRHRRAPDCSDLHNFYHLGGRYYLSTQQGLLPVFNTTDGSSHLISLTPLTVYHFPCELTFTTQQTGLGPLFHFVTFRGKITTMTF